MPVRRDGTLLSGKRSARDAFEGRAKEGVVANQALFPFFVAQGCTVFLWANQLLGKVGWPEGPHLRRGVFYGKDASSKRDDATRGALWGLEVSGEDMAHIKEQPEVLRGSGKPWICPEGERLSDARWSALPDD